MSKKKIKNLRLLSQDDYNKSLKLYLAFLKFDKLNSGEMHSYRQT